MASGKFTLTIDHTQVLEAPDYVTVELSIFPSAFWTALDAISDTTGDTIRVYESDDTTSVPYYIVDIDTVGQTGRLLMGKGEVNTSTDAQYIIHAGDSGLSAASDSSAVFSGTSYVGFYLPGMTLTDLTGSGRDLTAVGTPGTGTSAFEGVTAATYNGSSQYHYYSGTQGISNWPATSESFAYVTQNFTRYCVFGLWNYSNNLNYLELDFSGDISSPVSDPARALIIGNGSSSPATTSTSFSINTWHKLAGVRTGSTGTTSAYIDGGSVGTDSTTISSPTFNSLCIGARRNNGSISQYLIGRVAMAALSNTTRSANYISTINAMWLDTAPVWSVGSWTADSSGGTITTAQGDCTACMSTRKSGFQYKTAYINVTLPDLSGATFASAELQLHSTYNDGPMGNIDVYAIAEASSGAWDESSSYSTLGALSLGTAVLTGQTLSAGTGDKTFDITGDGTKGLDKFYTDHPSGGDVTIALRWSAFSGTVSGAANNLTIGDDGAGTPEAIFSTRSDATYYPRVAVTYTGTISGPDVTGTADADVSVTAAATGARGAAGTADADITTTAAATGARGVSGTAGATVSATAEATGIRGFVGTVAAIVSATAEATGIRGLLGTVAAAVSATAAALGARGVSGTADADIDVTADATDTAGPTGTADATADVTAYAAGYVGTLGPSNGHSVIAYLTGADADGVPQRDPADSTGGFRSGVRFDAMNWDWTDPLVGLTVLSVSGKNGTGIGTITAASAGSLKWTPPGGSEGAAVTLAVNAEAIIPGADTAAWVKVRRSRNVPLSGAKSLRSLDQYENLFPDVTTADAVAGLVTQRALMLRNENGQILNLRAWLGDCDGTIAVALEVPTAGELLGIGLTWTTATTSGGGVSVPAVLGDGLIGLHIKRTIPADTAPSPAQSWEVYYSWSDGTTTYTARERGRYRIERTDYVKEGIWIGTDAYPDFDAAPDETWTSRPHTTSLALSGPATIKAALRAMNKYGLWGVPSEVMDYPIDGSGDLTAVPPSGPSEISAYQTSGNKPTVGASYDAAADDANRADLWVIWLATDGTDPDGTGTPDGYQQMQWNAAIDDLAWTSTGSALDDGTPVSALIRTRRLDNAGGTAFSPDVIQLDDTNTGTLKVDADITDWPASGYGKTTTRFGKLLEVWSYSGIVSSGGQTTVTVDGRGLWGTTAHATGPTLIVEPITAVDSENTATATWSIIAVAPGRPRGAALYGTNGAQVQDPVTGPDGVTPIVLDAGENVHLLLGVGWASLYVDTMLVWRMLWQSDGGDSNALYIPSEWTLVEAAVTGAASGSGVIDAVDANTVYVCVTGQRRMLIDLSAMEITATAFDESITMPIRAEQDGDLPQFGATLFLTWDPSIEDYRPYAELAAAGTFGTALTIDQSLDAAGVEALWLP